MAENDEELDWPARVTRVIAREITRHRKERGMSVQQLSDAVEQLGLPIARPVLSNLENGRRNTISVAEVLALAAALNVPPVQLIAPAGYVDEVEALPGIKVHPYEAILWIRGIETPEAFATEPDREEQFRSYLLEWEEHEHTVGELVQHLFRRERGAPGTNENEEWERERSSLEELARHERRQIRDSGRVPAPLPPELTYLDEERPTPRRPRPRPRWLPR